MLKHFTGHPSTAKKKNAEGAEEDTTPTEEDVNSTRAVPEATSESMESGAETPVE